MNSQAIPLGKEVEYSQALDRDLLKPVPRSNYRELITDLVPAFEGADVWNCYEINCLDKNGIPRTFWLEFSLPQNTPAIPESKSLKLYLGSMFAHKFQSKAELVQEIESSIEKVCGGKPEDINLVEPTNWSSLLHSDRNTTSIDSLVSAGFKGIKCGQEKVSEILTYHSFRAICPVTSQPDFASVVVSYSGTQISPNSLASYFFSQRLNSGFHEYWSEKIFNDISKAGEFASLKVQLFFARRGGIAINPYRQTPDFYLSIPSPTFNR
jgi:7-cyano-7-deazaguanine reductase